MSKKFGGRIEPFATLQGNIEKPSGGSPKSEICFNSYKEFPSIGNSEKLYIATDENAIYRWDGEENVYICIGRDWNNISEIQCSLN